MSLCPMPQPPYQPPLLRNPKIKPLSSLCVLDLVEIIFGSLELWKEEEEVGEGDLVKLELEYSKHHHHLAPI